MNNVIYVTFKSVVMRDHKELIEMLYLAKLHCEILTTLGVHIRRRLIEERDPNAAMQHDAMLSGPQPRPDSPIDMRPIH